MIMKFIISTILIALLSLVAGMYLPWWSVALAAFLVIFLIKLGPLPAFFSGFLGVFICWSLIALSRDIANEGILSVKIAQVFPLGGSQALLIFISALIGGIVGGLAALTASYTGASTFPED